MSFDKLIAAATDYFLTGAEVHRVALAGGGGKITDMSGHVAPKDPPVGTVSNVTDIAPKKVATKATKPVVAAADGPITAEEAAASQAAIAAAAAKAAAIEQVRAGDELREYDLEGAPPISYEEDIRPVLRAKSLANRDALVALLGKFKVKSGQELTVDQYPAFLAGLKAI